MKTYQRSLLAAAVLFAALPLQSCGDADDYAQTSTITLTAQSTTMIVKREMIFTVTTTFPDPTTTTTTPAATVAGAERAPVINQCNPTLEYQATGVGMGGGWQQLPGTTAVRTFSLKPRRTGTLAVIARGKCTGSMEDWKYSAQVDITVTEPVAPGLPTVTLTANPGTIVLGGSVTFALSTDKPENCTVKMKYQYSGAGFGVTTVNPATPGQFVLTPTAVGTLAVTATAWCTLNPAAESTVTTSVPVTAVVAPTPVTPTSVTLTAVTASPYSIATGTGISFTLSAVAPAGCTLVLSRQHSGAGLPLTVVNPTLAGTFTTANPPGPTPGTVTIAASGWCTENPSGIVSATPLTISVVP